MSSLPPHGRYADPSASSGGASYSHSTYGGRSASSRTSSAESGGEFLSKLYEYVATHADQLDSKGGSLRLTLTPGGLHFLHTKYSELADLNNTPSLGKEQYNAHVAHILEGFPHHNFSRLISLLAAVTRLRIEAILPPQARDSICAVHLFPALTTLELRNCSHVQIHGLSMLRKSLRKLIVTSSISSLHSLLADCLADRAVPAEWPRLHSFSCPSNGLLELDESLRLLPSVQVLDFSRNKISRVAHLQYCSSLQYLNLAFNVIGTVEGINRTIGNCKTVILRGNRLNSLGSLGKLYALERLDLTSNFIMSLSEVRTLSGLPCLSGLWLSDNPIAVTPNYRAEVMRIFSSQVTQNGPKAFVLDDKPASEQEHREAEKAARQKQPLSSTEEVVDTSGFAAPSDMTAEIQASAYTQRKHKGKASKRVIQFDSDDKQDMDPRRDFESASTRRRSSLWVEQAKDRLGVKDVHTDLHDLHKRAGSSFMAELSSKQPWRRADDTRGDIPGHGRSYSTHEYSRHPYGHAHNPYSHASAWPHQNRQMPYANRQHAHQSVSAYPPPPSLGPTLHHSNASAVQHSVPVARLNFSPQVRPDAMGQSLPSAAKAHELWINEQQHRDDAAKDRTKKKKKKKGKKKKKKKKSRKNSSASEPVEVAPPAVGGSTPLPTTVERYLQWVAGRAPAARPVEMDKELDDLLHSYECIVRKQPPQEKSAQPASGDDKPEKDSTEDKQSKARGEEVLLSVDSRGVKELDLATGRTVFYRSLARLVSVKFQLDLKTLSLIWGPEASQQVTDVAHTDPAKLPRTVYVVEDEEGLFELVQLLSERMGMDTLSEPQLLTAGAPGTAVAPSGVDNTTDATQSNEKARDRKESSNENGDVKTSAGTAAGDVNAEQSHSPKTLSDNEQDASHAPADSNEVDDAPASAASPDRSPRSSSKQERPRHSPSEESEQSDPAGADTNDSQHDGHPSPAKPVVPPISLSTVPKASVKRSSLTMALEEVDKERQEEQQKAVLKGLARKGVWDVNVGSLFANSPAVRDMNTAGGHSLLEQYYHPEQKGAGRAPNASLDSPRSAGDGSPPSNMRAPSSSSAAAGDVVGDTGGLLGSSEQGPSLSRSSGSAKSPTPLLHSARRSGFGGGAEWKERQRRMVQADLDQFNTYVSGGPCWPAYITHARLRMLTVPLDERKTDAKPPPLLASRPETTVFFILTETHFLCVVPNAGTSSPEPFSCIVVHQLHNVKSIVLGFHWTHLKVLFSKPPRNERSSKTPKVVLLMTREKELTTLVATHLTQAVAKFGTELTPENMNDSVSSRLQREVLGGTSDNIRLYVLLFESASDTSVDLSPVSLVLTDENIFLCKEDYLEESGLKSRFVATKIESMSEIMALEVLSNASADRGEAGEFRLTFVATTNVFHSSSSGGSAFAHHKAKPTSARHWTLFSFSNATVSLLQKHLSTVVRSRTANSATLIPPSSLPPPSLS